MEDDSQSLFSGTADKIASFLRLSDVQSLKQRTTYRAVAASVRDPAEFAPFVLDLYRTIQSNRKNRAPSRENWRWKCQPYIGMANDSKEVLFERAVACLTEANHLQGWCNQIPVASGLAHFSFDKRAAVDLAKLSEDRLDLYELKIESDTPLFAAFEILLYGLAYVYCRSNSSRPEFDYAGLKTMKVRHIGLNVLAPGDYYEDFDLRLLQSGIELGYQAVLRHVFGGEVHGNFRFVTLPKEFTPPFASGEEVKQYCSSPALSPRAQILCETLNNIRPLHPS